MKKWLMAKILPVLLAVAVTLGAVPVIAAGAADNAAAAEETQSSAFADVKDGQWYTEYVNYVYEHKIMVGTTNTVPLLFAPDGTITRAQMVQALYQLAGSPKATATTTFTDVKSTDWFATAIAWAQEKGIAYGYSATKFGPNDTVTREQMIAFLYRYAQIIDGEASFKYSALTGYTDANKISDGSDFEEAFAWAVDKGIVNGTSATTLEPQGTSTRAQLAKILAVYYQYSHVNYVLMNIPYDEFYTAQGVTVDAVSGATAKVRNSGVAGATYNGGGNATNTTDVTDTAKGVQFAVKVDGHILADSKYTKVSDSTTYNIAYSGRGQTTETTVTGKDALIQADDYAYYVLDEIPANYVELTSDGFSAVQGDVTKLTGSADNITYGGHWGSYIVEFDKVEGYSGNIAAVTVITDKLSFGLTPTDHIWRNMEIAWDPTEDLAATNGATLQSLIVYTDEGVYEIDYNQNLKAVSDAEISATLQGTSGTVTGLPADIADATVTVSYTEGSGRQAVTTKVIEGAALKNGSFTIPAEAELEEGKTYTVTVSSSNYLDLSTSTQYNVAYVLMNIPYDVFYTAQGVKVDAVSGATAKVRNSGVAGATYNGGGDATNTTDVTDTSKGVQFAVKVNPSILTDDKYTEVTDATTYFIAYSGRGSTTKTTVTGKDALIQADDYAYYVLDEVPANYVELTSDGFSAVQGDTTKLTGSAADITNGGHHRKYEVTLSGISGKVAAVTVKTNALTFGLKATDQLWRSNSIGWDPTGDLAATNGAILQSLIVYTDEGVYEIAYNQRLKAVSDAEISATLQGTAGTVTGLPTDIADATVTVSYTEGSGRQAVTTKVVEGAALKDGSLTIPADASLEEGKTYTVTVSSSNYLDLSTTATYTAAETSPAA